MSPPCIMMSADCSQMLIFGMPTYGMGSAKDNYFASPRQPMKPIGCQIIERIGAGFLFTLGVPTGARVDPNNSSSTDTLAGRVGVLARAWRKK